MFDDFDSIDPETERAINDKFRQMRQQYAMKKAAAMKSAVDKNAVVDKQAIIDKQVDSNMDDQLDELTDKEPELPDEVQDLMSGRISDALSTAGGMVIIVKPREFQRMYLKGTGCGDVGEELHRRHMCFRPGAAPDPHFGLSGEVIPSILKALMPTLLGRSAAEPAVKRRVMMIKVVKDPKDKVVELDHPLMDKVSAAYSAYRRDLLYTLPDLIKSAMNHHDFRDFWRDRDQLRSAAVVKHGSDVVESLVQMLPVSYTNRAHFSAPISAYVDEHRSLDGLINAGALI